MYVSRCDRNNLEQVIRTTLNAAPDPELLLRGGPSSLTADLLREMMFLDLLPNDPKERADVEALIRDKEKHTYEEARRLVFRFRESHATEFLALFHAHPGFVLGILLLAGIGTVALLTPLLHSVGIRFPLLITTQSTLDQRLRQVELQVRPRSVTPDAKNHLVSLLSGKRGTPVRVTVPMGDSEAANFAAEILDSLQTAGWKASGLDTVLNTGKVPAGLFVLVRDSQHPPDGAQLLLSSLGATGLRPRGESNTALTSEAIQILVGAKPFP